MGTYIFKDLHCAALWYEDELAELAHNVAWIGQTHCLVVLLFLAQQEADMAFWNFYHF